jgi:hypothetical protein
MSEEINDSGLTSDAPATEPEIENPEDNVVPHKVDEQQENVSETKETKTDAAEKPEWLEDKFWDKENSQIKTEDLNKSFSELQKQFSMGKHKAPKEYDLEVLEDVDVDNDELSQFFLDWSNKYKPTQGAFNELVDKFKELSVAQEQEDSIDVAAEKQQLGPNADQIVKGTVTWMQGLVAKGIWSETDFEEGKIFTATADGINAINKIRQYYGEQTIPTAPTDVDGQPSREELFALVADPKYKTDPGFRAKVEKQFERAFPGTATDTGQI